eukprot:4318669-Prymnesium_polylepis.1
MVLAATRAPSQRPQQRRLQPASDVEALQQLQGESEVLFELTLATLDEVDLVIGVDQVAVAPRRGRVFDLSGAEALEEPVFDVGWQVPGGLRGVIQNAVLN